jgi:hypothetical protein
MNCNKCGQEIIGYNDYLEVEKTWGYYSNKDLDTYKFVLCEQCCDILVGSFKLPVHIVEYDPYKNYFGENIITIA